MHKQAQANTRQPAPLKSHYRRRVGNDNGIDPLEQYKPSYNKPLGGLRLNIDNDIIMTERGSGAGR